MRNTQLKTEDANILIILCMVISVAFAITFISTWFFGPAVMIQFFVFTLLAALCTGCFWGDYRKNQYLDTNLVITSLITLGATAISVLVTAIYISGTTVTYIEPDMLDRPDTYTLFARYNGSETLVSMDGADLRLDDGDIYVIEYQDYNPYKRHTNPPRYTFGVKAKESEYIPIDVDNDNDSE